MFDVLRVKVCAGFGDSAVSPPLGRPNSKDLLLERSLSPAWSELTPAAQFERCSKRLSKRESRSFEA